ncbi:OmpA family protein [Desulfobotulus sp. H1]|uniref:OmpA family protein n=1 Tax=Desulfobotulus pelophilus TaxID=2823377 RepID=A0ABT3N7X8_9BACT|nr:OmpA family protein [Desulfobotulus pelophilus]MCW7753564.1 OmpA family protein [Desulfobotulus pelophilus]
MKKSCLPGLILTGLFLMQAVPAFSEALNTLVVLRDGTRIQSSAYHIPADYTEEGLLRHDSSVRVRDLQLSAFRFTREGQRFFVPLEEARRKFASVELLSVPGSSSHGSLVMKITPIQGEPFDVQQGALIRHVGDEYPAFEMEVEKYVASEDRWQRNYLAWKDVKEIHFKRLQPVEKDEKPEEEERVLVGTPLTGDGHSVEVLTELLLAMVQAGRSGGRLSFDVRFDVNAATLRPDSRNVLDRLGAALRDPRLAGTRFRLGGHADTTGQAAHNLNLSRRRAESVRSYLVQQAGIETYRLEASGYGDTRPVATNRTPEGRQSNRRVEIEFLPPG